MHQKSEKGQEPWSLDDVIYKTEVKEREFEMIRDVQSEGCYITGLYLEGCRWKPPQGLDEAEPRQIYNKLPILYVTAFYRKVRQDQQSMSNVYSCPVYKYPRRTDKYIVFRVGLPCEGTGPHHWKLRGVAILCSTE